MGAFITLKNYKEFSKVYNYRKSFANKYLVMYIMPNSLNDNRIGISVSKKVGNSVVRHRIARLIRESYRLNENCVRTGYDIVVVVRSNSSDKSFHEIQSALLHLFKLHKILCKNDYR